MRLNIVYTNAAYFLLLALLPSFLAVALSLDSFTPGLLAAALIVLPTLLRYAKAIKIPFTWNRNLCIILVWILFIIPLFTGANYSSKSFLSLFIALFLLLYAFLIEVWFERCSLQRIYRLVFIVYSAFLIIGWLGFFFKVNAFGYNRFAAIFPFSEPAHFARIAGPIYVAAFFLASKKFKLFIFINNILQAILIQSTSLFCYPVIMFLAIFQVRALKFVALIVLILALFLGILLKNPAHLEYFMSRITFSPETSNLTSLVFLQGVVAAKDSLFNTNGLGLGFQMLGTEAPNRISHIISGILASGGELCRPSGGFIAAKLIAELGLLGVILVVFACLQMLISFLWLRRYLEMTLRFKGVRPDGQIKSVITNSLIVTFFVEMFLRGGGYFSLTAILFVFALIYLRKRHKYRNVVDKKMNEAESRIN